MSTIRANTLVNMDGVTAVTLTGQVAAKSWVNFNGVSGSVAARASFNVSSITRGATAGYYLIAFTTSMIDANFATNANAQPNGYGGAYPGCGDTAAGTQLSSRASLEVRDAGNLATDSNFIQVSVHR